MKICDKSESRLKDQFKLFDKGNKGYLVLQDLKEFISSVGENRDDTEIQEMFQELDPKGEGEITFEEFKKMMQTM